MDKACVYRVKSLEFDPYWTQISVGGFLDCAHFSSLSHWGTGTICPHLSGKNPIWTLHCTGHWKCPFIVWLILSYINLINDNYYIKILLFYYFVNLHYITFFNLIFMRLLIASTQVEWDKYTTRLVSPWYRVI